MQILAKNDIVHFFNEKNYRRIDLDFMTFVYISRKIQFSLLQFMPPYLERNLTVKGTRNAVVVNRIGKLNFEL